MSRTFLGTGIEGNVADKAKKLGIQVRKFGTGGASASPNVSASFCQVIVVAGELLLIRFSCYVVLSPSSSRLFFDKPCATM
jgi:hypothetical protein